MENMITIEKMNASYVSAALQQQPVLVSFRSKLLLISCTTQFDYTYWAKNGKYHLFRF